MRVLHVIPSLSAAHGGPSYALPLIARSLAENGIDAVVATTDDDGPGKRISVPVGSPQQNGRFRCHYFPKQTEFYKYSRPFKIWLSKEAGDYDLIHIHALFSYTSVCAGQIARHKRIPYVVRPLGVLNRWGMRNRRRLIKALSFRFIEEPLLNHAAAIHYTSEQEHVEAHEAGVRAPAFVAPLGLDLNPFRELPEPAAFFHEWPQAQGRDVVLFLSRLDPKKGLELLLGAFSEILPRFPNVLLVIAGDGERPYVNSLKQRAAELRIADNLLWTGFLDLPRKLAAFAVAKAFVLPSFSENFGIAAVEALAAGVPSILTPGVAISKEVAEAEAGLIAQADVNSLASAIARLLSDEQLATKISRNAQRLSREHYSIQAMGKALAGLYHKIVNTAKVPAGQ
jgi:glycosyltransferase involved in cell wall biosynthesis